MLTRARLQNVALFEDFVAVLVLPATSPRLTSDLDIAIRRADAPPA